MATGQNGKNAAGAKAALWFCPAGGAAGQKASAVGGAFDGAAARLHVLAKAVHGVAAGQREGGQQGGKEGEGGFLHGSLLW